MSTLSINDKRHSKYRLLKAGIYFLLAALALFGQTLLTAGIENYLGGLLIWAGVLEIYDGFKRSIGSTRQSAWASGAYSLLMAILLVNAELLQSAALYDFITVVFALDGARRLVRFSRHKMQGHAQIMDFAAAIGNMLVVGGLLFFEEKGHVFTLSMAVCLRLVGIGIDVLSARYGSLQDASEDVIADMGMSDNAAVSKIAQSIEDEELASVPAVRRFNIVLVLLLFFIHLGRMGFDRSFLGILSPLLATVGDMVIALVIAYAIIGPIRFAFAKFSGWTEDRLWRWVQTGQNEKRSFWSLKGLTEGWLKSRMRTRIRFRKAAYSLSAALRTGLRIGLPLSALLAAIMPVLGMSWYFDTENWASGVWDRWAATRADEWRMSMAKASGEGFGPNAFALHPAGIQDSADFSFVVVGDPGEGDASQLILKDNIMQVAAQPDVKFVVVSSDVVYPSGQLKDFEKKFWMPFKGVTKPIYAIPGNHDWYDAMDGFNATFLRPEIARKVMKARIREDLLISSTTDKKIGEMIDRSAFWRKEYGVSAGHQQAPFFQVSTPDFVLLAIETGVLRQIDSLQLAWVESVLEASKGKFVMALLGHPFYAIGEYQGSMNPRFEDLHRLLRRYQVPLVMAGDTHDLEYYQEERKDSSVYTMHHFVNGGGGAYLSIGTAMAKKEKMPTKEYAFYPSYAPLAKKIEDNTAWYKAPAWWWTRRLQGWPFSAEWLSAMFDYNVAPFFQSFMEIRVEKSKKQIRLIPYSNHGRISWAEMTATAAVKPVQTADTSFAEWIIPWK
jgi:uncharacterized membrane protein HdeD (DUF308 family)